MDEKDAGVEDDPVSDLFFLGCIKAQVCNLERGRKKEKEWISILIPSPWCKATA